MEVELIQATPNPLKLITDVASICYGREEATYPEKLLKHLNDLGHHSVFEHVYYTFKISGISTACLGQLTRHRHASYSVRSQRYCDESNFKAIVPNKIWDDKELRDKFYKTMETVGICYDELIEAGIKREDARSVLPRAVSTDLYMSMNLRELIHIYNLRTSSAAQEEIKKLATTMVGLVMYTHKDLQPLFKGEKE